MTKHPPGHPVGGGPSRSKLISGLPQFLRFLFAGLINAVAGFVLFLLFFRALGLHYLLSNVLVFFSWAWFGFELQRRGVFRAQASAYSFLKYGVNQIVFMLAGTAILWVLVEFGAIRPEVAYVITLGAVTVGIYLSSRLWVFRLSRPNKQE